MKLLITGICGFVGSELAINFHERFSDDGLEIVGLDNLSRNGSWRNRARLGERGITVMHGDIRNQTDVEAVGAVDWIVDGAANPSVLAGIDGGSRKLMQDNLGGTINLLEHCRQCHAGFVLLSTSRVYSIPPLANLNVEPKDGAFVPVQNDLPTGVTQHGINETYSTTAPVSLYGATKLASEALAIEYGHTFEFPVWVNRCGVMSGAGQFGKADQGIFAFWLHSWREKRALKYIGFGGQGFQVRDCLHPHDLSTLLWKQINTSRTDQPLLVNVSGGLKSSRSLRQLSEWCGKRWEPSDVTADTTPRPFDLPWVVLDHRLASDTWDWAPEISTDQILDQIALFADNEPDWIAFSR